MPKCRRLNSEETAEVNQILKTRPNKKILQDHVRNTCGKKLTLRDLNNLSAKLKGPAKDLEAILKGICERQDEDTEVAKFNRKDSGKEKPLDRIVQKNSNSVLGLEHEFDMESQHDNEPTLELEPEGDIVYIKEEMEDEYYEMGYEGAPVRNADVKTELGNGYDARGETENGEIEIKEEAIELKEEPSEMQEKRGEKRPVHSPPSSSNSKKQRTEVADEREDTVWVVEFNPKEEPSSVEKDSDSGHEQHDRVNTAVAEETEDESDRPGYEDAPTKDAGSSRRALSGRTREIVHNVYEYFKLEKMNCGPIHDITRTTLRTSEATKLSESTIHRIYKEAKDSFSYPVFLDKKRKRSKPVTNIDEFDKCVIHRTVLSFYVRNEIPTIEKVLPEVKKNIGFSGGKESLRKVLKEIGFECVRVKGRNTLFERTDVASARTKFLRQMKKLRDEGHESVVYLDEISVNQNYTISYCWPDGQSEKAMGVKPPQGKGSGLLILHAGSKEGFVPNAGLILQAKIGDYHHQMNPTVFEDWFRTKLLPNIRPSSVIVMDNASYHSVQFDKPPTVSSKKEVIKEWLKRNGASPEDHLNKCELVELVKSFSGSLDQNYVIDRIASANGHQIVRLPPYHCQYNAIELIWRQIKTYIAKKENFKMTDLKPLVNETLASVFSVTTENWANAAKHVENLEIEDAAKDVAIDKFTDSFVIEITSSDEEDLA